MPRPGPPGPADPAPEVVSVLFHGPPRGPVLVSYDTDQYRPGRAITDWEPENELFWKSFGKRVAARNLWIAVPALLVAFVVWQVWSVTATNLKDVGFSYSTSQLFWLTAIPGLTGGTARIFHTFLGPMVGQRQFTALSTAVLVVPLIWLGIAIQDPATPYGVMVAIPALFGSVAVTSAMWGFVVFYLSCVVVAWWFYARKNAEAPS
ncbi:MFS transporter [Streptomyces laurentii]|uniref:hypothetical protein n=1 Tax=Streptomyces laurentii TaxID=39478 RepID=UPI0036A11F4B